MMIFKAKHRIEALKNVLPDGFIFLLDTTDRSFIYKSSENDICIDKVLQLDQSQGVDALTRASGFHKCYQEEKLIALKKLDPNTYFGFCAYFGNYSADQLDKATKILMN